MSKWIAKSTQKNILWRENVNVFKQKKEMLRSGITSDSQHHYNRKKNKGKSRRRGTEKQNSKSKRKTERRIKKAKKVIKNTFFKTGTTKCLLLLCVVIRIYKFSII